MYKKNIMAEFVPFDENVEVSGRTLKAQLFNIEENVFRDKEIDKFLEDLVYDFFKTRDFDPEKWYPQKNWLDLLKFIYENIGTNTLLIIGRAIPDNAKFPDNIQDLKSALESIDVAYHMNHRNGEIGHYKLLEFDEKKRRAVMESYNPYPDEFDKGIYLGIMRKFAPFDSVELNVTIDENKETRRKGGDRTYYILTW